MDKYGYTNTVEQLKSLILLWRKYHVKIHTSKTIERSHFLESFNTIKTVTMRNEFLDRYKFSYSADSWDSIDNLFFHLTHSGKKQEWSLIFREIGIKTEMFKNIEATNEKLNKLTILLNGSPDISKFYIECFMFLLAMEGIYDEIIRFIYATEQSIDGKTPMNLDILKNMGIRKIKTSIKLTPKGIFGIWDDGHRVRNAIAHARFFYNKNDKKMRFVDVNIRDPSDFYITSLTVNEVHDLTVKIGVISAAFHQVYLLLIIHFLLMTKPEKIIK